MYEDLKSRLEKLAKKIRENPKMGESETRSWLINPLLRALGYDDSDPNTVIPEYTADPRDKKTGKVDYAIVDSNGQPIIYIEAKGLNELLDNDAYHNQLKRYFNFTLFVKFAILTNGKEYRFYTDLDSENYIDSKPFLSFKLEEYTDTDLSLLSKFHKDNFDSIRVREFAQELSYQSKILEYLKGEISDPDRFDLARSIANKALNLKGKSNYLIVKKILRLVLTELLGFKSTESGVQRTSNEASTVPVEPDKSEVQKTEIQGGAKNIFDVKDPTFHKLEYFEFQKERVNQSNFTDLYIYVVKKLFERNSFLLQDIIGGHKFLGIVKSPTPNRSYVELSDGYYLMTFSNAKNKFKYLKKILEKFDLKDSLYVKLVKRK